jgi:bifunctional UDP-N-acetylglucosamine pyrophosphorylase/glucosamine-1-phosphate N-acetyltransferase
MELSIVILAAGKGTRMKSSKAKVLHKIADRPMLFHIIKEAKKLTYDITVVLNHQADAVGKMINEYFENIMLTMQDIDTYPGTGGALKNVTYKHDHVLVLNGDMPLLQASEMERFTHLEGDIVMSILDLDNPSGYGRVIVEDEHVKAIVEEKDANEEQKRVRTVNAGVYLFRRELLESYIPKLSNNNAQQEYYLTDLISMANSEAKSIVPLFVDENTFAGVNSKYHLAQAEETMQARLKKHWMEQGVTMRLPQTIHLSSEVVFEGECEVESGVVIKGNTLISHTTIKANSVIEDAVIKTSEIGPMARIRPNSYITDSKIGNFVEVKKSTLNGVKAGHLSYLGDAVIDEGTNIGAGVITCNYDGINKHKTTIGKNVFVGSNSQLVAPVIIEDNVMVAAGTTVPKGHIKEGVLAIARAPMKQIKDFFFQFFKNQS